MIDCHNGSINSIQKRFNQCFGIPFNEIQFEEWRNAQMSVIALTPILGGKNFIFMYVTPQIGINSITFPLILNILFTLYIILGYYK